MRVNMNIPDELLAQIDARAKSLYVNRTAWIIMTLSQKLEQEGVVENLPEMLEAFKALKADEMPE